MTTIALPSTIAKKTASSSKKSYPIFDGVKEIVNVLCQKNRQIKALEGETKRLKEEVAEAVFPLAVSSIKNGGAELGVSALGDEGSALVIYKDDFRSGADLEAVKGAIGTKAEKLFRQRLAFQVSGDTLTTVLGPKKVGGFIGELAALFEKHGVSESLVVKEDFVPTSVRDLFEVLTLKQLQALNEVYKIPSAVSAK
jgi:hypothetical protein